MELLKQVDASSRRVIFLLDELEAIAAHDPGFLELPFRLTFRNVVWLCCGRKAMDLWFSPDRCVHLFPGGLTPWNIVVPGVARPDANSSSSSSDFIGCETTEVSSTVRIESDDVVRFELTELMEAWRGQKDTTLPGFVWLRSLRPPVFRLSVGPVMVLRGHSAQVVSVVFSRDGKLIASGSWDHTVRVWDAFNGMELQCMVTHTDRVNSVALSPDNRWVVSGSDDGTVRIWDWRQDTERTCLKRNHGPVHSVCIAPNGEIVAISSGDGTVTLWQVTSGEKICGISRPSHLYGSIAFTADGRYLIGADRDGTLWRWEFATAEEPSSHSCVGLLNQHERQHARFVLNTPFVVTCNPDVLHVWDIRHGSAAIQTQSVDLRHPEMRACFAVSQDGHSLAVGTGDGVLRMLRTATAHEDWQFRAHEDGVWSVAFAVDGQRVATGGGILDPTIRVWRRTGTWPSSEFPRHTGYVLTAWFSIGGGRLITTGSSADTHSLMVWDTANGRCLRALSGESAWTEQQAQREEYNYLVMRCPEVVAAKRGNPDLQGSSCGIVIMETVIKQMAANLPIAWYPVSLHDVQFHPGRRLFAGGGSGDVYLFAVEGATQRQP